jgi:Cu/Ag efflux protein CusF
VAIRLLGAETPIVLLIFEPEQREAFAPVTGKLVSRVAKSVIRPVSVTRRMLCAAGGFRSNKGVPQMIRLPKWVFMALALALLVGLAGTAAAAEIKGKIKIVTADKNELVVTDKDGKEMKFQVNEDAKISLADKDTKLAELKVDDDVTVTFEKKDGKLLVSIIRSERK